MARILMATLRMDPQEAHTRARHRQLRISRPVRRAQRQALSHLTAEVTTHLDTSQVLRQVSTGRLASIRNTGSSSLSTVVSSIRNTHSNQVTPARRAAVTGHRKHTRDSHTAPTAATTRVATVGSSLTHLRQTWVHILSTSNHSGRQAATELRRSTKVLRKVSMDSSREVTAVNRIHSHRMISISTTSSIKRIRADSSSTREDMVNRGATAEEGTVSSSTVRSLQTQAGNRAVLERSNLR